MLIIDVGNSKTKIGVFIGDKMKEKFTYDTERCLVQGFLRDKVKDMNENIIAFSSVVPEITNIIVLITKALKIKYLDVSKAENSILKINYKFEQLGGDRLANVVAAYKRYNPPLLVIDFGTATTYDIVLANGIFEGGIIAPGIKTCIDFLVKNTGLLPEIPLKHPDTFLGHTTEGALISGFYYTFLGQMKEIIENLKIRTGGDFRIIGTGGLVEFAKSDFPQITVDKDLTLYGIKMLYEANR